ncbi:hypothetical protein CEXT_540041, partial [Caerostris extrusa]
FSFPWSTSIINECVSPSFQNCTQSREGLRSNGTSSTCQLQFQRSSSKQAAAFFLFKQRNEEVPDQTRVRH